MTGGLSGTISAMARQGQRPVAHDQPWGTVHREDCSRDPTSLALPDPSGSFDPANRRPSRTVDELFFCRQVARRVRQ